MGVYARWACQACSSRRGISIGRCGDAAIEEFLAFHVGMIVAGIPLLGAFFYFHLRSSTPVKRGRRCVAPV